MRCSFHFRAPFKSNVETFDISYNLFSLWIVLSVVSYLASFISPPFRKCDQERTDDDDITLGFDHWVFDRLYTIEGGSGSDQRRSFFSTRDIYQREENFPIAILECKKRPIGKLP